MAFNYKLIGQVKQAVQKLADSPTAPKVESPSSSDEGPIHTSPPVTKHQNINPVYPRVKFGPPNDLNRVVKSVPKENPLSGFNPNQGGLQPIPEPDYSEPGNPAPQGIPGFNPNQGALQYIPKMNALDYMTSPGYNHPYLIPSFGNVSKNLTDNNIPGASRETMGEMLNDFYDGDTRKNFYNSLDKTIADPKARDGFSQSLKNMASWASDNRVSKPTRFVTYLPPGPRFIGPHADPGTIQTPENSVRQSIHTNYKGDLNADTSFGLVKNPNGVFLHELEHTNQATNPAPGRSPATAAMANLEMPAVISEIAHQAAAAHEATGKYPKGDFYGVPYETIAREAQRRGHVYGNVPMTELLKHPDAQKWLGQVSKGMKGPNPVTR